jgi:hypothetical protein
MFDKCASRMNLKTKNNKLAEIQYTDYMNDKIISDPKFELIQILYFEYWSIKCSIVHEFGF